MSPASAAFHQRRLGLKASLNGMWLEERGEIQDQYLRTQKSKKSARVWLIRFTRQLQSFLHTLWKTRNEAIHTIEDSDNNTKWHNELNTKISEIFGTLPNLRLLPTCDAAYFKRGEQRIKNYRLRRKELWVEDATRIRDAFFDSLDAQSESFLNFFVTPSPP